MAAPLTLNLPQRDPRAALRHQLEKAPLEHAEALLSAYEVLQGLHERGVLEMLRGALGSSDKVLEILVEAGNSPEAIRGIRNLMILAKIGDSIEPEMLEGLAQGVPRSLAQARQEPLSYWQLLKKLFSQDTRRALTMMTCMLEAFGKGLRTGGGDQQH